MAAKKKGRRGRKPKGKKRPCKKKCKRGVGSKKGGRRGKKKIASATRVQMTPVALVKQTKPRKPKKKKKRRSKSVTNTSQPSVVKITSRARPSPVMGRIYFGSGFGGGGLVYGSEQVGGGYNNVIRTSTNPDFQSLAAGDYLTRTGYGSMSGAGIGAVFSTVFKTLLPVFKGLLKVGSTVAKSPAGQAIKNEIIKSGLKTGIGVVGDALRGANIKKSAKSHVVEQVKQFPGNVSRAVLELGKNTPAQKRSMTDKPPKSSGAKWRKKDPQSVVASRPARLVKSVRKDFFDR